VIIVRLRLLDVEQLHGTLSQTAVGARPIPTERGRGTLTRLRRCRLRLTDVRGMRFLYRVPSLAIAVSDS
jgi:hypothetical protein